MGFRGEQNVGKIYTRWLLIRSEPEWAPNTRETGSGVYIYIYIFVSDGNDLMRMLKHHVFGR